MTKDELLQIAAQRHHGRTYPSSWTKTKLIENLRAYDASCELAAQVRDDYEAAIAAEAANEGRELVLFRQPAPDESALDYPYSHLGQYGYDTDAIRKDVLGYEVDKKVVEQEFPDKIAEYYWIHPGVNDEESWLAFGRLESGAYFFYKAWCDYTGFDCQGGMDLYAADDWQGLLHRAMSSADYNAYREECTVRVE